MRINLRKAAAVQSEINEVINGISFTTSVSIDEFQVASEIIDAARELFFTNLSRRSNLMRVLYDIRADVAKHNVGEINDLLNDLGRLNKHSTFLENNGFHNAIPMYSQLELANRVAKLHETPSEYIHSNQTSVNVDILSKDQIDGFKTERNETKRDKKRIQDKLLELNINKFIEIAIDDVELLRKEGIL